MINKLFPFCSRKSMLQRWTVLEMLGTCRNKICRLFFFLSPVLDTLTAVVSGTQHRSISCGRHRSDTAGKAGLTLSLSFP